MADIEYRRLGKSGLIVSSIGIGCNNFGRAKTVTQSQEGTDAVIHAAIDAGITFFDTADMYGAERGLSETLMGNSLRGRRDDIVLSTKFGMSMDGVTGSDWGSRASRRYIRRSIEGSLRRLQTEWIDLYQLHEPDLSTPIEETLSTLDDLIREGKVRYIGHSNMAGWQIAEAEFTAELNRHPKFISAQNEYNLMVRDAELEVLPAVRAYGLGFLPFFPLYNGLLTGKFTRQSQPPEARITAQKPQLLEDVPWDALESYADFCEKRDITMVEATFAWLLAQPNLSSVIAGATTPEQVRQNAAAGTSWVPDAEEVQQISDFFDPDFG